jgi:uncharacterized protein YjiS (DUF1127 family)
MFPHGDICAFFWPGHVGHLTPSPGVNHVRQGLARGQPMPLNDNQRKFIALYRATTPRNAQRAYEAVYKAQGKVARDNAARLLANASMRSEIDALDAADLRDLGLTAADVLREIALIGFADMSTYATWGPDGVQLKDAATLSAPQRRVVGKVSQTVTQHGGTIRFELADKLGALKQLGQYLKLWKTDVDLGEDTLEALSRFLDSLSERKLDLLVAPNGTADLLPHQQAG